MKQQVNISLKLILWIDAALSRDEIATLAQARLKSAFATEIDEVLHPVTITSCRQEAEIYGGRGIAMTNIQHTPAPWEDNGNGLIYGQCSADDDEAPFVADVCKDGAGGFYSDEEQANARLIAAAPAMFAALKNCAVLLADYDEHAGEEGKAYRDAVAAISQATGGRL